MDPPIQNNSLNRKEVRLKWIGNETIKLGIKLKYLSIPSKLVIHQYQRGVWNSVAITKVLHNQLLSDPNNFVIVWPAPSTFVCRQSNDSNLNIFDYLPADGLMGIHPFNRSNKCNPYFIYQLPSIIMRSMIDQLLSDKNSSQYHQVPDR